MQPVTVVQFVLGVVALIGGSELLVKGASRLAAAFGISPLVIGLTVVALGTSSPEMAIGVQSALAGQGAITVGDVVGSSILNVLLILGIAAVILPLTVAQRLIRLDVPLMVAVAVAFFLLARDGQFSRIDGLLLFSGAIAYTAFCVRQSRKESRDVREEYAEEFGVSEREKRGPSFVAKNLALIVAGLALLLVGSNRIVDSAITFAKALGVSELIIGLTVIAIGTSLPEIATTVMASLRGERDIAVGNVIGSNLFNMMLVTGLSAAVAPQGGIDVPPTALQFDIPVMIAVTVACLPIFFIGGRISRWEGALFLAYYAAYTTHLVLDAAKSDFTRTFDAAMLYFALPLTAVTLLALAATSFRHNRREAATSQTPTSVE